MKCLRWEESIRISMILPKRCLPKHCQRQSLHYSILDALDKSHGRKTLSIYCKILKIGELLFNSPSNWFKWPTTVRPLQQCLTSMKNDSLSNVRHLESSRVFERIGVNSIFNIWTGRLIRTCLYPWPLCPEHARTFRLNEFHQVALELQVKTSISWALY